jgi:hypothetical protein
MPQARKRRERRPAIRGRSRRMGGHTTTRHSCRSVRPLFCATDKSWRRRRGSGNLCGFQEEGRLMVLDIPRGWDDVEPGWMTSALQGAFPGVAVSGVDVVLVDDGTNRRAVSGSRMRLVPARRPYSRRLQTRSTLRSTRALAASSMRPDCSRRTFRFRSIIQACTSR